MEQDRGGIEDFNRQNQDRRLKPMQGENQQQQQQQQPQKCPRCESLNTKFCYYNNYSLSQPRYFCKTCRRYWTQGGTLRNVPVGGGCRKAKRPKASTSSSSLQNMISTASGNATASPPALSSTITTTKESSSSGNLVSVSPTGMASNIGSYYPGGGFLNSLAAIQSLNNQPVNLGVGDLVGGSSNLGILHGFSAVVPSFATQLQQQQQQQIQQPKQFYQMGNRDNKSLDLPFYDSYEDSLIRSSNRPPGSSSSNTSQQQNWHLGFASNITTNSPTGPDTALWSISTTTTTTAGNTNSNNNIAGGGGGASSLNQEQWHDLPGYGRPP